MSVINESLYSYSLYLGILWLRKISHFLNLYYSHYQQELIKILTKGKPSQVKLAGRIVTNMYPNSSTIFQRILEVKVNDMNIMRVLMRIFATMNLLSDGVV